MPRYHFNVYDGVDVPDPTGVELPGLKEARFEAVRLAGALLRDEPTSVALGDSWLLEVTDDSGLVLFRLDISMSDAPVLFGKPQHTDDAGPSDSVPN